MSFVNITNMRPSIEPWGTPYLIVAFFDYVIVVYYIFCSVTNKTFEGILRTCMSLINL